MWGKNDAINHVGHQKRGERGVDGRQGKNPPTNFLVHVLFHLYDL